MPAPALGLLDVTKPFHLFVAENRGIAKGVLTQKLGPMEEANRTSLQDTRPCGGGMARLPEDCGCGVGQGRG